MSGSASNSGDIFDVRKIRRLVELMNEHELSEIDLKQGDMRIRLRRHREPTFVPADHRPVYVAPPTDAPAGRPPSGESPPAAAPPAASEHLAFIKSPMVGTFYAASNPEAAPFVKVGDHVGPDTTVCVIEAMKVFNEIPAEISGQIVSVLVENGEPVEYGQPLFKVDTSK